MTTSRISSIFIVMSFLLLPVYVTSLSGSDASDYKDEYFYINPESNPSKWDWSKVNWGSGALAQRINSDETARQAYMKYVGLESVVLNPGKQRLTYGKEGITHPNGIFYAINDIPKNSNIQSVESGLIITPKGKGSEDGQKTPIKLDRIPTDGVTIDTKGKNVILPDGTQFSGKISYKGGKTLIKSNDEAIVYGLKITKQNSDVYLYGDGSEHSDANYISANSKKQTLVIKSAKVSLLDKSYLDVNEKDQIEFNLKDSASAVITNRKANDLHPSVVVDCPDSLKDCGSIQNGKLSTDIKNFLINQQTHKNENIGSVPFELWNKDSKVATNNLVVLIDNNNQAYLARGFEDQKLGVRKMPDYIIKIQDLVEQNDELNFRSDVIGRFVQNGPNPHDLMLSDLRRKSEGMVKLGKMDLHRHMDEKEQVDEIFGQLKRQGYTISAITNHNNVDIFNQKYNLNGKEVSLTEYTRQKYGIESIPGVEVTAQEGSHFLVYFGSTDNLNRFMGQINVNKQDLISPVQTPTKDIISAAKKFGGAITIAHPNEDKMNFLREKYGNNYEWIISQVDGVEGITGFQQQGDNAKTIRQAIVEGMYPKKHIYGSSDDHGTDLSFSTSYTEVFSKDSRNIDANYLVTQMEKNSDESGLLFYPRGKSIPDYEKQSLVAMKKHLDTVNWQYYQQNPDKFIASDWPNYYDALTPSQKDMAAAYFSQKSGMRIDEARNKLEDAVFAKNNPNLYYAMSLVKAGYSSLRISAQTAASAIGNTAQSVSSFANK